MRGAEVKYAERIEPVQVSALGSGKHVCTADRSSTPNTLTRAKTLPL